MKTHHISGEHILAKAQKLGASLAGLVPLSSLRESARHRTVIGRFSAERASLLVLALEHPEPEPELDWWGGEGGTEGNRRLIAISKALRRFLAQELSVRARPLPYHPWRGGVLLKDAAALAGLGCIGDNNLLITPRYGPRVRLRALLVGLETAPQPRQQFAPCETCPHPCWQACPQQAFATGAYAKAPCARQMGLDETQTARARDGPSPYRISYCRACELACPVGR
jgi:epoxyqueuosine reductase